MQIVGTWADQGENQTELYPIAPGGLQDGDTWAAAATGAYDDRWRASLTTMAQLRAGDGATYIRPFHEFNLAGWDWSVTPDQADDFTTAWKRYRAIQREVFPQAKLVYGVNVTSSGTGLDWRTTWPGADQADVLGVDTYNGWPTLTSAADFEAQRGATGAGGIPIGLDAYSQQAADWGVPLAVPEWSGRAQAGDEPAFITGMHDWFAAHAGTGPGQLAYEILFNAPQDENNFTLFGDTRMPESAQTYQQDFSDAGSTTATSMPSTTPSVETERVPSDAATDLTDEPASETSTGRTGGGADAAPSASSTPSPSDATAAPTADLPGWRHVFADDFTTDAPAGTFLDAYGQRWGAYSVDAIAAHNGVMDLHIGNLDNAGGSGGSEGKATAAAPFPLIHSTDGAFGQTYGRYSVRFMADPVIGMHMAWLLWPDDDSGPDKGWTPGEVDFPEADLDYTLSEFNHCPGDPIQNCRAAHTGTPIAPGWHTATTEWSAAGVTFIPDGAVLGTSTKAPTASMHWVLQTETELGRTPTADGHVLVDWVSVWSRDGTAGAPATV